MRISSVTTTERGRSVVASKRNFASLISTTTQSSNKLQKVPTRSRPTCSQTETTSPSAPKVSVARVFFQPNVIGNKASGVHDTSFHNIMKCNVDIRVNSYVPVMLPGGTTMFQEIGDRMTKKTTELPPPTTKIKVVAPPERQYSVRIGVSIFFLFFSTFQQMWISKVSTMDLARPSSIGGVSELTMLTSCLEQQCSMEFMTW